MVPIVILEFSQQYDNVTYSGGFMSETYFQMAAEVSLLVIWKQRMDPSLIENRIS
jgi:hypothetical protein